MNTQPRFSRLLIYGATGHTGRCLVQQALARGHRVTAVVRDPAKLDLEDPNLSIATGNLGDIAFIDGVSASSYDAALMTLGITHHDDATPLADLSEPIVSALERRGIRRFVCMTSLGCGDSKGQGNFVVKLIQTLTVRHILRDKEKQERYIMNSGLDWTIVRPPRLLDRSRTGDTLRWSGAPPPQKIRWEISYADAAAEMLGCLDDDSTIGEAMQIASPKN